jgi:benzylsuccinate CoA-transferase BbsF subunit
MSGPKALDGVRVVELSIAIAAPAAGRLLAFHGADVIRIESRVHPDVIRLLGSAWARTDENRAVFMDSSPYLAEFDAGKRCVGLELKQPGGLDVAKRLVAQADVFLTNYSTPAVRALGLGYEDVRAVNEDIIYVALPGFGSDEKLPYYPFVAWGPNQAPLVGMDAITGYPDQEPCGIATVAPPDYLASLHAVTAVLAGLEDHDVSGDGCYVDISQFEASVAFLGPFIFENQLTGREQQRVGNRDARMAPSGVYPCGGVERYVAISVGDDAMWSALCRLAGKGWDDDSRFTTVADRLARHDELDELLAGWTSGHGAEELAARLQEVGVAAHAVLDAPGVLTDAHVRERGWFKVRPSGRFERDLFSGQPIRFSNTPADVATSAPALGEHTVEVLREVAGLTEAEVGALLEKGVAFNAADPERVIRRPYDRYLETLGLVAGHEGPARG